MSTNILPQNKILGRMKLALQACGLGERGRNKAIANKTGYSTAQVSSILSGKESITDRFLQALESNYSISKLWIRTGEGDMFIPPADPYPKGTEKFKQYAEQIAAQTAADHPVAWDTDLKTVYDSLEIKVRGRTAEERLEFIRGILEDIQTRKI